MVVVLAHESYTVTRIAPVGTVLSDEQSLATLLGGSPTVVARVSVEQRDSITIGDEVTVSSLGEDSDTGTGSVSAVSEFIASGDGTAGFDLTVSIVQLPTDVQDGALVRLRSRGADEGATSLAVPMTSLREDSEGIFVWIAPSADPSPSSLTRVRISLGRQHDGFVEVRDGDLAEGDLVVVAGA